MREHELAPAIGSRKRRKRLGRGNGSGRGTYSGRGMKGQKSRAGKGPRPGFEGGQLPLIKRLPMKRGFVNIFRKEYAVVNLKQLETLFAKDSEITPQTMLAAGIIKNIKKPIKVLGNGQLSKPLNVRAHRFSHSAKQKITAAQGDVQEIQ